MYSKTPWYAEQLPADESGETIAIGAAENTLATCPAEEPNACLYVAHCFGPDREDNARLIVAAHGLLEACKAAYQQLDRSHASYAAAAADPLLHQLRTAIDAAEGRT